MAGATRATSAHQCVFTFQKSGIWKITLHFKQKTIREIRRRTSLSKNARVLKVTAMCYSTQLIVKFKFVLPLPSDKSSIWTKKVGGGVCKTSTDRWHRQKWNRVELAGLFSQTRQKTQVTLLPFKFIKVLNIVMEQEIQTLRVFQTAGANSDTFIPPCFMWYH